MNYNISFEHGLRHSYMHIKDVAITNDAYETRLMRETSIPGALNMIIDTSTEESALSYDISGLEPMDKYIESNPLAHLGIARFMENLNDLLLSLEEYMISENSVVLVPSAIFYKEEEDRWVFTLIPDCKSSFNAAFSEFLTYLLKHIDYKDDRAVIIAYSLFQETSKDFYQITDLLRIVKTNIEKENELRNQLMASRQDGRYGDSGNMLAAGTIGPTLSDNNVPPSPSNAGTLSQNFKKKTVSSDGIFRPSDAGLVPTNSSTIKNASSNANAPTVDINSPLNNIESSVSGSISSMDNKISFRNAKNIPGNEQANEHSIGNYDPNTDIDFSSDYGIDDYPEKDVLPGVEMHNISEEKESKLFGILSYPKKKNSVKASNSQNTIQDQLDKKASDISFKGKIFVSALLMILIPSLVWFLKGGFIFRKTLPLIIALEIGLSMMIALDLIMHKLPDEA